MSANIKTPFESARNYVLIVPTYSLTVLPKYNATFVQFNNNFRYL